MWKKIKINYEAENLIFFCNKGLRSAEVFMYAYDSGFTNSLMFNGWK